MFGSTSNFGVLINVGARTVKGALFSRNGEKPPHLIFTTRLSADPEAAEISKELVTALLDAVLKQIVSECAKRKETDKISFVKCVFEDPWFVSNGKTLLVEEKEAFVVSKKILSEIISDEEKGFEKEIRGSKTAPKEHAVRVVERRITKIYLNGYEVKDPIGKRAKNMSLSIYMSMMREDFLENVFGLIERHVHIKHIEFGTSPFVSFMALREKTPSNNDSIIVDIGEERTVLTLIRNGALLLTLKTESGVNSLIREVSRGFGTPFSVSLSNIILFKDDQISQREKDLLGVILGNYLLGWVDQYKRAVEAFIFRPKNILLISEDGFSGLFRETLEKTSDNASVEIIDGSYFANHFTAEANAYPDTELLIAALTYSENSDLQ